MSDLLRSMKNRLEMAIFSVFCPQGEGGEGGNDRPPRRRNFRTRVYRRRPMQGQGDEEQTGDAPVSELLDHLHNVDYNSMIL